MGFPLPDQAKPIGSGGTTNALFRFIARPSFFNYQYIISNNREITEKVKTTPSIAMNNLNSREFTNSAVFSNGVELFPISKMLSIIILPFGS
jgi:hypothetical protein